MRRMDIGRNNKGLSLLELIIAVCIMAVLVAILSPMFMKQVERSKKSKDLYTAERFRHSEL